MSPIVQYQIYHDSYQNRKYRVKTIENVDASLHKQENRSLERIVGTDERIISWTILRVWFTKINVEWGLMELQFCSTMYLKIQRSSRSMNRRNLNTVYMKPITGWPQSNRHWNHTMNTCRIKLLPQVISEWINPGSRTASWRLWYLQLDYSMKIWIRSICGIWPKFLSKLVIAGRYFEIWKIRTQYQNGSNSYTGVHYSRGLPNFCSILT